MWIPAVKLLIPSSEWLSYLMGPFVSIKKKPPPLGGCSSRQAEFRSHFIPLASSTLHPSRAYAAVPVSGKTSKPLGSAPLWARFYTGSKDIRTSKT